MWRIRLRAIDIVVEFEPVMFMRVPVPVSMLGSPLPPFLKAPSYKRLLLCVMDDATSHARSLSIGGMLDARVARHLRSFRTLVLADESLLPREIRRPGTADAVDLSDEDLAGDLHRPSVATREHVRR